MITVGSGSKDSQSYVFKGQEPYLLDLYERAQAMATGDYARALQQGPTTKRGFPLSNRGATASGGRGGSAGGGSQPGSIDFSSGNASDIISQIQANGGGSGGGGSATSAGAGNQPDSSAIGGGGGQTRLPFYDIPAYFSDKYLPKVDTNIQRANILNKEGLDAYRGIRDMQNPFMQQLAGVGGQSQAAQYGAAPYMMGLSGVASGNNPFMQQINDIATGMNPDTAGALNTLMALQSSPLQTTRVPNTRGRVRR